MWKACASGRRASDSLLVFPVSCQRTFQKVNVKDDLTPLILVWFIVFIGWLNTLNINDMESNLLSLII